MAINIITGFFSSSREQLDKRSGPYDSTADALSALGTNERAMGLPIYIISNPIMDGDNYIGGDVSTYHFTGGIADANLIEIESFDQDLNTTDDVTFNSISGDGSGLTDLPDDEFDSSLSATLEMQDAIGSIPAGTTISELQGMTFTQYIELQNFPTVIAYISDNSNLSLSGYSTAALEVGSNYSFSATMSFDTGVIKNGDGSSAGSVSGNAITFDLENPDGTSYTNGSVSANSDSTTTANYSLVSGDNNWTLSGTNAAGSTTYLDNKGGTDTVSSIESAKADTTPLNVTFNKKGYYPLFYGMSSSDTTGSGTGIYLNTDLTKQVANTGDRDISLTGTNEYIYFAYPSSSGSLSSIVDGNGFNVTGSFTLYTVDVTSSGQDTEWTESYNIYRTTAVTTVSGQTFEFNF